MPPLAGIDKLRADYAAKDKEIDTLMELSATENRSLTPDEMTKMKTWDGEAVAIKDAIEVAERKEAREAERNKPPESRGVRSQGPGAAPAVHTEPIRPYSLHRAIRIGAGEEDQNGLEWEVHQEMKKQGAAMGRKYRGIAMPTGNDPETRKMMGRPKLETRDMTTTTIGSSIYVRPDGFIDLLRANLVIQDLGATFLRDLKGVFALTRQNSTNQLQWIGEGASVTPTNLTFDRVNLAPHFAGITSVMTREAMMQSSVDLEQLTEDDFARDIALGIDFAAIYGPTGGASPIGLLNNPLIPSYVHAGGNGGPFTYGDAVNMETAVSQANAGRGRLAYLTNPRMRGSLKQQFIGSAGYPLFVFGPGASATVGVINGYPAFTTTQVPSNLTAGSSTGKCSAVIYAAWQDLLVAQWDTGLDMVVDPYTQKRAGNIEVTMYLALDIEVRHNESFIACQDALPQY